MGEYARRGGRRSYLHPLGGSRPDSGPGYTTRLGLASHKRRRSVQKKKRLYNEKAMDSPWVTRRIDYDLKMLLTL